MSSYRRLTTRSKSEEVLTVDYQDVLTQAVANERWRVLREVHDFVDSQKTTEYIRDSYRSQDVSAERVKTAVLEKLRQMEAQNG